MTDTLPITIIVAGTSFITAMLGVAVTAWLGGRNATNAEVQLGLDALKAGLETATKSVEVLNAKLGTAEKKIIQIEQQYYRVLSENNRFRIIHGVEPAHSLESFVPVEPDQWDEFVKNTKGAI
ncbi:MAG: hypothetical protein U0975_08810 [Erythrobacter sp.]|nr:hypothetical protein [Erythrobacter sp.]MDZ4135735.1 hypothetical protein [Paracoccaceae bacterium]MDZ4272758.1 hypothetical protein [Erythrobacter sp.]